VACRRGIAPSNDSGRWRSSSVKLAETVGTESGVDSGYSRRNKLSSRATAQNLSGTEPH
jgi:hypothetical protein